MRVINSGLESKSQHGKKMFLKLFFLSRSRKAWHGRRWIKRRVSKTWRLTVHVSLSDCSRLIICQL